MDERRSDLAFVKGDDRRFGATFDGDRTNFCVWAPSHESVSLRLKRGDVIPMQKDSDGWHRAKVDVKPGEHYQYSVGDVSIVDPAASAQSSARVRGWSVVTDPNSYTWENEDWAGRPWTEVVLYEAHPGLSGGFRGLIEKLPELVDLGITALELMPIAQFPGSWNWGYDGVLPFAPDRTYGTPDDLKALVDAAHGHGLMIFLDVVYNHFGPDGNILPLLSPEFFRDDVKTPWGTAIDFRRPEVRQFFTENATTWICEFRFDGLRFDAVHAIEDEGWLVEMATEVRAAAPGRHVHLVLENDDNIASLLRSGFDAQWNDDYHHVLHVMLTGERDAYYQDYADRAAERLARALADGFVYQGEHSGFRGGPRGTDSSDLPPTRFVNFLQNHDQIGNRAFGERLITLTDEARLKAAIALQLLEPQIPLIFMGEEIGAKTPFHYFVDHKPKLIEAIREGRKKEFQDLIDGAEDLPEPNATETFENSKPEADPKEAADWRSFYQDLLEIRATRIVPHLGKVESLGARALTEQAVEARWRLGNGSTLLIALNLGDKPVKSDWPAEKPLWGRIARGEVQPTSTVVWLTD